MISIFCVCYRRLLFHDLVFWAKKKSRAYICKTVEKRDEIMKIVGWIGLSSRFGIRARGQTCTPALRHHFTSNTDSKIHTSFFHFLKLFDTIYSLLVHTTCLFSKADIVHLEFFFGWKFLKNTFKPKTEKQKTTAQNFFQIFYLFYNKSDKQNVEKKEGKLCVHFILEKVLKLK